jgi:DNA (cytosine-5)-methyltransferase 1
MQGGNRQPKIMIKNNTKQGYDTATDGDCVNLQQPNSETRRGRVGHQVSQTLQTTNTMGVVVSGDKRLHSLVEKTNFEQGKVLNMDLYNQTTNENISQCLTDAKHNSQRLYDGLRIRKLTPKECWRLMRIP